MPASRFECPRCQTVFVKDIGGDQAFVECPSCGALALPAGDATEGDLSRALSGPQPAPERGSLASSLASTEAEQPPAPSDPAAPAPGLFSGLLEDVASSSPNNTSGDGFALPPAALPPLPPAPPPMTASSSSSASSSGGAMGAQVSGSARAPELDFNLGDLDLDFPAPPVTSPGRPNPLSSRSMEMSSPFAVAAPGGVHVLPADAMAALAADSDAGPTNQSAPFGNTLSEEAFGDLEKAFDEMALRPQAVAPRGALSADEQRFLRGDDDAHSGPRPKPPPLRRADGLQSGGDERTGRPEAPPLPPVRKAAPPLKKQKRSTHFELSAEAKKLAFLPLVGPENSGSSARPARVTAGSSVAVPSVERIDRTAATTQNREARSTDEDTDFVRADKKPARRQVPSAFHGLSFLKAAAIVLVCGILGGVGGAFTAPPPKTASTARSRAELRFADGNRFYDAGRYDDALGAFRGAISIDSTFALAHRAKGAALAKLNRHDEAVQAYEEYLKIEPKAIDAVDVEAAIARREGRAPRPPPVDAPPPPAPTPPAPAVDPAAPTPPAAPTAAPGTP